MHKITSFLLSLIPRQLPVGMTEFNIWANRILKLAGPIATEDSLKWVLCTDVLRLSPTSRFRTDYYFVSILRKAAANQIVSQAINDIKDAQEQRKLEAAKQQAEATAQPTQDAVVSNDQQKS